ncbi:MAG: DoxX family membrane protein [Sphingobacteriales bacterium]|nr:MAG: DoxX family membrane protein [Sphingobacteriales bacterium]
MKNRNPARRDFFMLLSGSFMNVSRQQIADFAILALRWYLAYYMFDYGVGKLMGNQFGAPDPRILDMPVKQVDRFFLAWHLFGLSRSFNVIVGLFQILGGVLIVMNRTALVGAVFLLPIIANTFFIDLAFTSNVPGEALTIRLACMMLSDFIILYYYRNKLLIAWQAITRGISARFRYPWWVYLLLVPVGLLIDATWGVIIWPLKTVITLMLR